MADLFAVNSFSDLKMKSSGGGGFSDGGVINHTVVLQESGKAPVVAEIAPPPGVSYGPAMFVPQGELEEGGPIVVNFDTQQVDIEEYFVSADGTETLTGAVTAVALTDWNGVSPFFQNSGCLQYPNKLRYKFAAGGLPTAAGRVILKYTLMEFDRPSDQG